MGTVLIQLGRFDEAQSVIEQAIHQRLATATSRRDLYQIAAVKDHAAMMQQQVDWAAGKPEEYWALYWQAQSASFAGRLRLAADFYARTAALIDPRDPDRAASFAEEFRLRGAVCGLCRPVKAAGDLRLRPARISQQSYIPAHLGRALSLALCGEPGAAQSLANEVAKGNPQSTLANFLWLPVVRAAVELQRANPELAIQALQAAAAYEPAAAFWPNYLRGQAYLRLSKGAEAAAEFQRILDHRGWDALSPLYTLARLGMARATALTGDGANCRQAYQAFLTSWKDADRNLPILQTAEREYEKLK